jgi:hypothetical protein
MIELVFLLEERSAEAMLEGLLPRILPAHVSSRFIVFEGKQDLEKQLVRRIRGYRSPYARFVVLRDKDSEDCLQIKRRLKERCKDAGRGEALIRIACHNLESWYLGDLLAVELGLGDEAKGVSRFRGRRPFDVPDRIGDPTGKLRSLVPSYQKIGGSRAIGKHLDADRNHSGSFVVFVKGILQLVAE